MKKTSVIGIGETKFGKLSNYTLKDMIKEAGEKAIFDAGINKTEIQAVYVGNFNSSFWAQQSHIGPLVAETLELGNVPTLRVEGACASGGLALRQGIIAISSGLYDTVLVGGIEKMTNNKTEVVTTGLASASDYLLEANRGATFPSLFAMMANRYFYEYRNVRKEMAMVAVQNHENALLNPDAQLRKRITIEDVCNGFPVADPLTVYDCSLISDGAVFIVLKRADLVDKTHKHRVVDIVGSGQGGDALTLHGKKSVTQFEATIKAAAEAYNMAGLTHKDIQFAEVHDCFTITQIINTEDLGFFKKGSGGDAVLEGKTSLNGSIPINTSGGLKAKGHPIGGTGLSQIFELVTQIRGQAGERQIKSMPSIGLAQNLGGSGATCVVSVLKGRD